MRHFILLFCVILLLFTTGCMQKKERRALIDSYNEAVTLYEEVVHCISLEQNTVDQDTLFVITKIGEKIKSIRNEIATDTIEKKRMNEIEKWLSDCKKWSKEAISVWRKEESEAII